MKKWDYEFDDDDEEEEEDIADELLYGGGKAKIIGSDEKSNNMLWDQIINLRKTNLLPLIKWPIRLKKVQLMRRNLKAVRFAEHLDINEVENIESLRNPPPETGKMSLFKQNRMSSQQKNQRK